ncbi:hypothetical protein PPL_11609 [Heterostelium album PN500]|uniref:DUF202 domain-containing protein n=1 Tax=Heterostelium pallidum (strain ATCC 26659 / Pp 5 / PN500) TaxID=670386 RepID=D3BV84_HETP5|nr:hypothetical protein PPL_11609 [Heterostelium album PN500]EFA74641.1 hypothetical protein PPL_11609 [Heterostelium album PN500]|eukprot:XP_020426775.1 hypothetical protein PPL_11609 [Heterostelium album PN500]
MELNNNTDNNNNNNTDNSNNNSNNNNNNNNNNNIDFENVDDDIDDYYYDNKDYESEIEIEYIYSDGDEEDASGRERELIGHFNNLNDEEFEELYNELLPELDPDFVSDLFASDNSEERQINEVVQDDINQLSSTNISPMLLRSSGRGLRASTTTTADTTTAPNSPSSLIEMKILSPLGLSRGVIPNRPQPTANAIEREHRQALKLPYFTPEDLYAADRLLAAYFRTGLALMTIGVGFGSRLGYSRHALFVSTFFFCFGIFAASLGSIRNFFIVKYLKLGYILPLFFTTFILVTLSLGLVGVSIWAILK